MFGTQVLYCNNDTLTVIQKSDMCRCETKFVIKNTARRDHLASNFGRSILFYISECCGNRRINET